MNKDKSSLFTAVIFVIFAVLPTASGLNWLYISAAVYHLSIWLLKNGKRRLSALAFGLKGLLIGVVFYHQFLDQGTLYLVLLVLYVVIISLLYRHHWREMMTH